ncbi:hypothetical protein LJR294_005754 [Variovorax paradoxus]
MSATGRQALRQQLVWSRLLAVVEEQAQALIRTAFGTPTREAATSRPACSCPTAGWSRRP